MGILLLLKYSIFYILLIIVKILQICMSRLLRIKQMYMLDIIIIIVNFNVLFIVLHSSFIIKLCKSSVLWFIDIYKRHNKNYKKILNML